MDNFTRRTFLAGTGAAMAAPFSIVRAQSLLRRAWSARWISVPGAPAYEYGVHFFRRTINLDARPQRFLVHATGDNRYQLFVNGRRVAWGPARGDLFHWRYETVDVAPYLEPGENLFAALVWYFSDLAPEAQIMNQTGFLLQGDTEAERSVDTGPAWKCARAESYEPLIFTTRDLRGYFVVGPADRVTAAKHPWGWEQKGFDDSKWAAAATVGRAAGRESRDSGSRWMLVERPIPLEAEKPERLQSVLRVTSIGMPKIFPAGREAVAIPAWTTATLLLDNGHLTTAYPELTVSGGSGATVRMRYAESLFERANPNQRLLKGNRNEVDGKTFLGYHDEFLLDGGQNRRFRPLWWRTYRYLELYVDTKADPVTIEDLEGTFVTFPFERRARFDGGSDEIQKILDVGWRTAQLCAHETYMDCPYYEQLQYGGDTRVQCLVSVFNAGDARLMRNAIDLLNDSRLSEGCTQSRYPTRLEQYIPAWTMWWVGMVHDYWWYSDDPEFVKRMLPGVRAVISFFNSYQKENGSLGPLPWWRNFDWVDGWPNGDAPQEADGSSAPFDFLMLMVYRWAAELEEGIGLRALGEEYRRREQQLRQTTQALYWDAGRRLYADTPAKKAFSQHSNTLAVIGDVITGDAARDLMLRILDAPGLSKAALFFRFYVHRALTKVGEGDRYLDQLDDWRNMLAKGLSTFAETVDPADGSSRSDCHAWSASPNIEIFRTVLGVDSAAPGFSKVVVAPHPGKLAFVRGSVPHPKGSVDVAVEPAAGRWNATVTLPAGVTGEFVWKGTHHPLNTGRNTLTVG